MRLEDTTRQKSGQLELPLGSRGEAPRAERSGEVPTASNGNERSGATTTLLMEQVVERSNIEAALKKVLQNKGSPGIDGMIVQELSEHMAEHWEISMARLHVAVLTAFLAPGAACHYFVVARRFIPSISRVRGTPGPRVGHECGCGAI